MCPNCGMLDAHTIECRKGSIYEVTRRLPGAPVESNLSRGALRDCLSLAAHDADIRRCIIADGRKALQEIEKMSNFTTIFSGKNRVEPFTIDDWRKRCHGIWEIAQGVLPKLRDV